MADDIVLPSDPEELEEYEAERDLEQYWRNVISPIAKNLTWLRSFGLGGAHGSRRTPEGSSPGGGSSDDEAVPEPPAKRMKTSHSLPKENVGGSLGPLSLHSPQSQRRVAHDISNLSPSHSLHNASHDHPANNASSPHSPTESVKTPVRSLRKPYTREMSPSRSTPAFEGEDQASVTLDEYAPTPSSQSYIVPSPSRPQFRSTVSPDPLLLPNRTPQRSPPVNASDIEDDLPVAGPSRLPPIAPSSPMRTRDPTTSPLSSVSSSPSRSPRHTHTRTSTTANAEFNDGAVDASPAEDVVADATAGAMHDSSGRRYRLRERTDKQLHPYVYDKQLYRKVLRHNPEAIIHVDLNRRRHRSRSRSVVAGNEQSSDPDVDPAELEAEESESERRRRRRTRSVDGDGTRRSRSRTESERGQRRRRDRVGSAGAHVGRQRGSRSPRAAVLPTAMSPRTMQRNAEFERRMFPEFSDSENEYESLGLSRPDRARKGKGKQTEADSHKRSEADEVRLARKKRRKRFPMKPDMPQSPEGSSPAANPSRSRIHGRISSELDTSDVEVLPSVRPSVCPPSRQPSEDQWAHDGPSAFDDGVPASDAEGPPESSSLHGLDSGPEMDLDRANQGRDMPDIQQSQDRDQWNFNVPDFFHPSDDDEVTSERDARHPSPARSSPIDVDAFDLDQSSSGSEGFIENPSKLDADTFYRRFRKHYPEIFRLYPRPKARQLILESLRPKPTKQKQRQHSAVSNNAPLQPGRVQRRVGNARDVAIRGDSESEDEPRRTPSPSPSPSPRFELPRRSSQSSAAPRAGPSRPGAAQRTFSSDVIEISSGEDEASQADDEDEGELEFMNGLAKVGEAREGTLVDYMLNRTRRSGKTDKVKAPTKRRGYGRDGGRRGGGGYGGRGGGGLPRRKKPVVNIQTKAGGSRRHTTQRTNSNRPPPIRAVIGGATKYGVKRQTLLNFPRIEDQRGRFPDPDGSPVAAEPSEFDGESPGPSTPSASTKPPAPAFDITVGQPKSKSQSKHAWQKARARMRDRVYFLKPHISTVVNGRQGKPGFHTTVIEEEEAANERTVREIMHFPLPQSKPKRRILRRPEARRQQILPDMSARQDDVGVATNARRAKDPLEKREGITVNLNITKLPSGIVFTEHTYLGRGYLPALLKPSAILEEPTAGYIGATRISTSMSPLDFAAVLSEALNELLAKFENATVDCDIFDDWQRYLRVIRPWSAWFLAAASLDDSEVLRAALKDQASRIYAIVQDRFAVRADGSYANMLLLQLQWFAIELLYQLRPVGDDARPGLEDEDLVKHVKLLMQHLWACNLDQHLGSLWPLGVRHLNYDKPIYRVAEWWVCLIHLLEQAGGRGAFWTLLLKVYQEFNLAGLSGSKAMASEALWTAIYSFTALSQFSMHGNTTSSPRLSDVWALVVVALDGAPLVANPAADASVPELALKKRDRYIGLLLSRCVWLHSHWGWTLGTTDALKMFHKLLNIFKSRRFANLRHEKKADFPNFLKEHKLALLQNQEEGDSAFTSFLKLIVQAHQESEDEISKRVKQVLQMAVPLGSIQFNRSHPASPHESSMFYNRISAVAIAIYLEPTQAQAKNRVTLARQYVNFKETDQATRQACIRGAMYLAILLQHFGLPLIDALGWLENMTNILVDEFKTFRGDEASRPRSDAVKCIQMILACTRRIIETPRMDEEVKSPRYPDPALLNGPWVTVVFDTRANLASTMNTALELRMLVQSFLKARRTVIPSLQPPRHIVQEDSQDYDCDDFDWDDPAVLGLLGDADVVNGDADTLNRREEETCKIIDEHVGRILFSILCRQLSSRNQQDQDELDKWLECWVGCAEVMVRNRRRDWSFYFAQASRTWEIMKLRPTLVRRIELQISLTALQLDPTAYASCQDLFLKVLFNCLAAQDPTLEAEYVGLVFTVDGLQHPLFRGLPCEPSDGSGVYKLSRVELVERRVAFLDCIFSNLENDLSGWNANPVEEYFEYIRSMLSTMQDILKNLDLPGRVLYGPFCSSVSALLASKPRLHSHAALREHVSWLHDIDRHGQTVT